MNYLKTFLPYLFGNKKGKSLAKTLPLPIPWATLSFEETLMFHTFSNSLNKYISLTDLKSLSKREVFHLFNFLDYLSYDLKKMIEKSFSHEFSFYNLAINAKPLCAKKLQELLDFKNRQLTLFAILNSDRTKPGVLLVRAADGQFITKQNHNIWSIPILGLSGLGLSFNYTNGCTPAGLFTIDSVMPNADKNYEFGKFRRLIVNFIELSPDEEKIKKLIPRSHQILSWWTPSVLGRELGRNLLRIHGTGRINLNPLSSFYPFVPTSGCLTTNESGLLKACSAQDQRFLLDVLMSALGLPATDENESKIHGLLYVVEFDDNLNMLRF